MPVGISIEDYKTIVRELSDRIVLAQKPIRILDTLKWDSKIQEEFMKHRGHQMPKIDSTYYLEKNPLSFEPEKKREEFHDIERSIRRQLGQYSGVGSIMLRMCHEYVRVIDMLEARGTPKFTFFSQELYGSAEDAFHVGAPTLKDLGNLVSGTLKNIKDQVNTQSDEKLLTSEQTVELLREKLRNYFYDKENLEVVLSDGIIADAAAGAEKIKIHKNKHFSEREIRAFEVHEGWVHLGTTLNGMAQPVCTFLSKGPPSSTITQEGLAIITELFTFSSYPGRLRRLTNRINAVAMAEEGANFLDVFEFYREQGFEPEDSYHSTMRVFRGSTPDGGPYTKDLSYSKGFILIYNYLRLAIQRGMVKQIPLLFVGKTTLEDIHILDDLYEQGLLIAPKYIPPQFKDLAGLSAWMVYSLFLNKLDLQQMATDFKDLLQS